MKLQISLLYLVSYICGGIPFGVVFARMRGIDLLSVGSGNIGATNVKRALGTKIGLLVFVLDVLKATVPSAAARLIVTHPYHAVPAQVFWFLAGLFAVLGHCVSPFLKFKGGKGVSTALGMVVGAAPAVAGCCFSLFLVLLFATRYMSLASMIAVTSAIVFGWMLPDQARELVPLYIVLSIFVIYRHRPNIKRLRNGTEPKFSFKDKPSVTTDDPSEPPQDDSTSEDQSQ
jgi:glycerol-3-phosphate acyltransferase PlsY